MAVAATLFGEAREPEIHQLHLHARRWRSVRRSHPRRFCQHDVRGFEIAMDDALAMRAIERARDLGRDGDSFVDCHRRRDGPGRAHPPAREAIRKRCALEILHHQEIEGRGFDKRRFRGACSATRQKRPFATDVVQHADIRVIE
jgi:hypothetical protein